MTETPNAKKPTPAAKIPWLPMLGGVVLLAAIVYVQWRSQQERQHPEHRRHAFVENASVRPYKETSFACSGGPLCSTLVVNDDFCGPEFLRLLLRKPDFRDEFDDADFDAIECGGGKAGILTKPWPATRR